MVWLDLLAVQRTLKRLLQHHSTKASILQHSAFFMVQLSHPYMTTRKTKALTIQAFISKVMSLLFNMLSRFVIAFLPITTFYISLYTILWCEEIRVLWGTCDEFFWSLDLNFCLFICLFRVSQIAQLVKNLSAMQETLVLFLGQADVL